MAWSGSDGISIHPALALCYRSRTQPCGFSTRSNFQKPSFRPPSATTMVTSSVKTGRYCARTFGLAKIQEPIQSAAETNHRDRARCFVGGAWTCGGRRTSADGSFLKQPRKHELGSTRK